MPISIVIEAKNVSDLHVQLGELLKGHTDNNSTHIEHEEDEPKKPVTEDVGTTENVTEQVNTSHPPIPDDAKGKPLHVDELPVDELPVNEAGDTPELDNDGLPWDERIHSTKKSKTKGGTWKTLRIPKSFNDDHAAWKTYVDEVTAELMLKWHDKPGKTLHEESENPGQGLDDPNGEFNPPAGSSEPTESDGNSFDDVLAFLADVTDHDIVLAVCKELEIVNVFELERKPELIPDFYTLINKRVNSGE